METKKMYSSYLPQKYYILVVCDPALEMMWLTKPKIYNNNQYYADKPFEGTF
jgi:hypothetical protein